MRKYPISPAFPRRNYKEISVGIIPRNSPINPCGNMGEVDALPAGVTQTVAFVNVNLPQKLVVRAFHLSQSAATLTFKILPLSVIM